MPEPNEERHPLDTGAISPTAANTPQAGGDEAPKRAPYVPPMLVRHGSVQAHTLGGGSFNP